LGPVALANTINLRAADFPGFQARPNRTTTKDRRDNAQAARCVGATPPDQALAQVSSDDFDSAGPFGFLEVSSEVDVMPQVADVRRDLVAIRSPRMEACLRRLLVPQLVPELEKAAGGPVRVSDVRFSRTQVDSRNTDGAFG